jgi:hypothetical protein
MGIDAHPRANSVENKQQGLSKRYGKESLKKQTGVRATFQDGQCQQIFFVTLPPSLWLMPTVPNN